MNHHQRHHRAINEPLSSSQRIALHRFQASRDANEFAAAAAGFGAGDRSIPPPPSQSTYPTFPAGYDPHFRDSPTLRPAPPSLDVSEEAPNPSTPSRSPADTGTGTDTNPLSTRAMPYLAVRPQPAARKQEERRMEREGGATGPRRCTQA